MALPFPEEAIAETLEELENDRFDLPPSRVELIVGSQGSNGYMLFFLPM